MKTKKMWLLFFGVKGVILLAPLSFVAVHYMIMGAAQTSGTGINAFENGLTKLMYAAQRNDLSGIKSQVKAGADLDLQSTNLAPNYKKADGSPKIDGSTALHFACAVLDNPTAEQIIRVLVNAGANVRIKNQANGETPLHSAAYFISTLDGRLLPIIEVLVKNGADINARNDDGNTIMHYAVDKTRRDWLEAFLSGRFGALVDRSVKNNKGETAEDAARIVHPELLDYFKKPAPVFTLSQRDKNGLTGLMIAVIRGNADLVRTAKMGDAVLNERTVEQGQDKYGYTALELAIMHQRPEFVKILMDRGTDPNVKDARGSAPLHLIYKFGSSSDRTMVIDALVNGIPASVAPSSVAPVNTALSSVAPVNTALSSVAPVNTASANTISVSGASSSTVPVTTVPAQDLQKSSLLKHADLNIQDALGNTLLHRAVMRDDQAMVRFLLEKYRAQLNLFVKNNNGDTPAQLAKALGYTAVKNLLEA
jgi:ankyrin repeat protein